MNAVVKRSAERFDAFLQDISTGKSLDAAMLQAGLRRSEFEAIVRNPAASARWSEARLAGLRSSWSVLDFDEIFSRLAAGVDETEAVTQVRGDPQQLGQFYELVAHSADLRERHASAMKTLSLRYQKKMLDVALDEAQDVLEGPKGPLSNMARIGRANLQVSVFKDLMAAWNPERFGTQRSKVEVSVVDHAAVLTAARARLEKGLKISQAEKDTAIDVVAEPVLDATWEDPKP
jgi:hypothetical protein